MYTSGYIVLHRKILEWQWYGDLPTRMLFEHLLLTANWKSSKWQNITIDRGQKLCSLDSLSRETHLSVQQIRTAIKHLKATGEITSENVRLNRSQVTLFSVVNYEKYQTENLPLTDDPTSDQQVTNKSPTSDQHDMNNINNIKNLNKGKKVYYCSELNTAPSRPATSSAAVFEIGVLKGETFSVYREDIDKWQSLYPSVNIEQQIRNMIGWLEGHPKRRKTLEGMPRFIHNWLSGEQNKGGQACVRNNAREGLDFSFLSEMEDGE